jgi:hypothetical protein
LTFSGAALVTDPAVGTLPGASADAAAAGALADSVTLDAADDVPGLQADSASPTPKPSAEMPVSRVAQMQ